MAAVSACVPNPVFAHFSQVLEIKYRSGTLEEWDDTMVAEVAGKDGTTSLSTAPEPATDVISKAPKELPLKVRG